jgi:membrane associated rhomboid family serine protease
VDDHRCFGRIDLREIIQGLVETELVWFPFEGRTIHEAHYRFGGDRRKVFGVLPIRDLNPSATTSFMTWLLVGICAYAYFFVQGGETLPLEEHLYQTASIPCEVVTGEPLSVAEISGGACRSGDPSVFPDKNVWFSVLASIFFHGSLLHLLSNLWVLLIFGNNVEDAFGHGSYLIFYLAAGVIASGAHVLLHPDSTLPVVGASGAIAGVMGTYAVLFPSARVTAIIPPFFFWPFALPALLFLLVWFGSQFLLAGQETVVAWEAHVAGFLFGVVIGLGGRKRLRAHSTRRSAPYRAGRLAR